MLNEQLRYYLTLNELGIHFTNPFIIRDNYKDLNALFDSAAVVIEMI